MKFLIASDIHGSELYCRQLLDAYTREGADRLLLLGDILYHGPRNDLPDGYNPKGVIALLNSMSGSILCVRGNCEAEVDQMVLSFPVMADYCIIQSGERFIYATHGHIYNENNLPPLKEGDILLHGHTHIPVRKNINGITVLNPGSVSLPKGGSERGYLLCEDGNFVFKRLSDGEIIEL